MPLLLLFFLTYQSLFSSPQTWLCLLFLFCTNPSPRCPLVILSRFLSLFSDLVPLSHTQSFSCPDSIPFSHTELVSRPLLLLSSAHTQLIHLLFWFSHTHTRFFARYTSSPLSSASSARVLFPSFFSSALTETLSASRASLFFTLTLAYKNYLNSLCVFNQLFWLCNASLWCCPLLFFLLFSLGRCTLETEKTVC